MLVNQAYNRRLRFGLDLGTGERQSGTFHDADCLDGKTASEKVHL